MPSEEEASDKAIGREVYNLVPSEEDSASLLADTDDQIDTPETSFSKPRPPTRRKSPAKKQQQQQQQQQQQKRRLMLALVVQKSESYDVDGFSFLASLPIVSLRDLMSASSSVLDRLASLGRQGCFRVLLERVEMAGPDVVKRFANVPVSFEGLIFDECSRRLCNHLYLVAGIA